MAYFDFDFKQIFTATMILFAVIDVVGNIFVFVNLRKQVGTIQSGKAAIVASVVMVLFLFLGEGILSLIGIDVSSFAVAGSFVLFFIAMEMILGIQIFKPDHPQTASVVPIAFPIIAGPGCLTSILSLKAEYETQNILVAIIVNMCFVYLVLKLSKNADKFISPSAAGVIRKVFGIVLLAIAVKLFTGNISILIK